MEVSSKKANQSHTLQNNKFSKNEAMHTTCSAKGEMKTTDSANKLINTLFCT